MEQLILMKQRIKAVETIKKVTHAMRLISMSAHTRLNEKKKQLQLFKKTFETIHNSVQPLLPNNSSEALPLEEHHLLILVGSQKGLCGPFNTSLFKVFNHHRFTLRDHASYIGIGSFAVDYLLRKQTVLTEAFPICTADTFVSISQAITDHILALPRRYSSVTIFSNKQKSFFVQMPSQRDIYPFTYEDSSGAEKIEYLFEQSPQELKDTLERIALTITFEEILFDSLISEQAARFVSMDSSTRNAENLLTTLKTGYNKVRQANITRELAELSAGQ